MFTFGKGICCTNGCKRMQNGQYSTCCKACGTGVHTADCNSRNGLLCANNCGRTKCCSYQHCCPDCGTGGHTSNCDNRNNIQPSQHHIQPSQHYIQPVKVAVPATKPVVQRPYLTVDSRYGHGQNSALVTLHGCNYGNTAREPHVDFKGNFPPWGTKYFLGPAKVGGIRNEAIMRDLLDPNGQPTQYHVTVYHESAGQGSAASLLSYYSH